MSPSLLKTDTSWPVSMKFDHIGVIADTLNRGRTALEGCFDIQGWTTEFCDGTNCVYVQFCHDSSGICYEVVAPLDDKSPVMTALLARHNVLNHVAYLVDDLTIECTRLRMAAVYPVGPPKPAIAYGGRNIQFFVTPLRFIIELIEAPHHAHVFDWEAPAKTEPELGQSGNEGI